ncbi:proteasome inhibitor 31 kDa [Xylocopa sonorina]|uniref:proteasome inhibitor 31 kDa n=1 Tax=Xylocopa sonorina TaxID=1818115 RepID=UPI00403AB490
MGDEDNLFAFEILQELYQNQIVKKEDVIILFVHWYLIKHGFRCIGLGDSKVFEPTDKKSQLLPEGWNTRPNYAWRYVNDNKLFLFHGIKSDEDLLINLLNVNDQNHPVVSSAQFPINQTVNNLSGQLESVIPTYQDVMNVIQTDLIDPLLPGSTTENSTQTALTNFNDFIRRYVPPSFTPRRWDPEAADPSNIGAADLDPLARGGGGMIFNPFAPSRHPVDLTRPGLGVPGRLPPGAVPPFARYDPFGPPDINQPRPRRDPDNDHLPPPGYDDMFM